MESLSHAHHRAPPIYIREKNMGLYMNDTHSDTDSYESDYVVVDGVEPDGTHQVQ